MTDAEIMVVVDKQRDKLLLKKDEPLSQRHIIYYLQINNINIYKFSLLLKMDTYKNIVSVFGKDGAATIDSLGNKRIIINDLRENDVEHYSEKRWLFTLFHECGHFALEHLNHKDCLRLSRGLYDTFEREADVFATNFLMPMQGIEKKVSPIIKLLGHIDCCQLGELATYFNVSWSAIIKRLHDLEIQDSDTSKFLINTYHGRKYGFEY